MINKIIKNSRFTSNGDGSKNSSFDKKCVSNGGSIINENDNKFCTFQEELLFINSENIIEEFTSNINKIDDTPTSGQKWWISLLIGLIFFILANPKTYQVSEFLLRQKNKSISDDLAPIILNTVIFILTIRILLW